MNKKFWEDWSKYGNLHKDLRGWQLNCEPKEAITGSNELDSDGCPIEDYSNPVIAVDDSGVAHIAVYVTDYRDIDCPVGYFRDAHTGEEIEVKKWMYIPK